MNKALSVYLNFTRFFAAMLVFVYHMGYFAGWKMPWIGGYGSEAVIVFFVLSGFVISYTAKNKHPDFRDYALSRLARLWSVMIPALALTCILDVIGQHLSYAAYSPLVHYSAIKWVATTLANLIFLNQFWSFSIWPGTDGPFWSIAFEFWYYAIFGAAFYLSGRWRIITVIAAFLIAGPKIVAAFPIWLIGTALLKSTANPKSAAPLLGALLWLGSFVLLFAFFYLDMSSQLEAMFPALAAIGRRTWQVDFIPKSYLLGLIFGMNLYGFILLSGAITRVPKRIEAAIGLLADASFGIYLLHYPIGYFVKAVLWSRGLTSGPGYVATIYLASFVAAFALGILFDPLRRPLLKVLRQAASLILDRSKKGTVPADAPSAIASASNAHP